MSIDEKATGVWQISPESPRPRPRRRNGPRLPPEQRREQLLDAARAVVGRDGLAALTMQAVAKQAGVAKPVLYAVFPTAPELVGALLHREHSRGIQQVLAAMPDNLQESNPDDEYETAVMAFLAAVQLDPVRWRLILMHADGAPSDYRELLGAARERIVARCVQLLEIGIRRRGGPRDVDIELVGNVLLGFVEVLARLVLSDPDRFPPQRLQATVRALAHTLPKNAGAPDGFGDSVVEAWRLIE